MNRYKKKVRGGYLCAEDMTAIPGPLEIANQQPVWQQWPVSCHDWLEGGQVNEGAVCG